MNRLLHHSAQPIGEIEPTLQTGRPDRKPRGFWVSVEGDDDWLAFCGKENFSSACFRYTTEIVLKADASVLVVEGTDAFTDFDARYRGEGRYPDWSRVSCDYQGIIIAPYLWGQRMASPWYYPWDCASGCIWNPVAVAEVRQIDNIPFRRISIFD